MTRIQFARRYDHPVGNGTQELYAPGDVAEFDDALANALVYEGFAAPAPDQAHAPLPEDRETKVDGPAETKPAGPAPRKRK